MYENREAIETFLLRAYPEAYKGYTCWIDSLTTEYLSKYLSEDREKDIYAIFKEHGLE